LFQQLLPVEVFWAALKQAQVRSPTGSPRSSPKRANSPHAENGQRLASYAEFRIMLISLL